MHSLRRFLISALLILAPLSTLRAHDPLQILMLHSYSQEYPWTQSQHEGFINGLHTAGDQSARINSEYLDSKRRKFDADYARQFSDYLAMKYPDYQPSLVYVSDDNALSFALNYLPTSFGDVPIIFSGVNNIGIRDQLDPTRVTGVFEKKNISANLALLLEMDADVRNILVVGDASETYQAIEMELRQQLQQYPGIEAKYVASHSIDEVVQILQASQSRYLFLTTLGSMVDRDGHVLGLDESIAKIINASDFVVFSMEDAYLLDGVLGGLVTSGQLQGGMAARMAIQFLQGTPVEQLAPVSDSPGELILDYRELEKNRLTLPPAALQRATLLNQPPSFYNRNRPLILGLIVVLIALFIFSLLYFLAVLSRKNIQIESRTHIQKLLESKVNERTRELLEERQKLRQAQAITHIGNYHWDVVDDSVGWSDELYRIVGHQPTDFKPSYEAYLECIHPDDREYFQQLTRHVLEDRKSYSAEYRILRPDGEVRYIHEQGDVKTDEQRKLLSLVGVIQDITERKQHESTLRNERDFNDTVLETAGNVIIILDMNGCFVRFNRAAEELTGYSSEQVLGKPVWDFVIPEDQMADVKKVFENLRNGKTDVAGRYENDWVLRDGSRRTLEWRNTVLRDKQDKITHIVTLGYDLTDRYAAAAEQDRLQRELNQSRKMEALGQLTGGIAHDFNNMLGIVIGYTDLARDQYEHDMEANLRTYLENISTASNRARELVKQMMVFCHDEKTKKKPAYMQPLLEENLNMLRSVIPSSIKIQLSCEDNLPQVMIDAVQLQQIMMNLCLNAKDAMGGIGRLDIDLRWHRIVDRECNACHKRIEGDWIELTVSDDGTGMDEQVVERIFEPFFTTKEVGKGTGMGMSVLHAIMDSHDGHVFIDTLKDQGTSFRLLFPPLATVSEHRLPEADAASVEILPGDRQQILIVDNEHALAEFMQELLSNHGYECTSITNSLQALEHFRSNPDCFDLLITDQTMPDLTGIELIKEIRNINPALPVILATGYSDNVNRNTASALNIHFMDKPVGTTELLTSVATLLKTAPGDQAAGR